MENYLGYPRVIHVYGNFITDRHGYFESLDDLECKQCTVEGVDEHYIINGFSVNAFKMLKDMEIRNMFSFDMQYCSYDGQINLFICDQVNVGDYVDDIVYNPIPGISDKYNVTSYESGYSFILNPEYIDKENGNIEYLNDDGENINEPHFIVLLDFNQGVEIPEEAKKANYSFEFMSAQPMLDFKVKFVFMDKDKKVIGVSEEEGIVCIPGLEVVRQQIIRPIPVGAKYVAPEFQIPEGLTGDEFFHFNKNCLLFDNDFIGFVRNPEEAGLLEEEFIYEKIAIPVTDEGEYSGDIDIKLSTFKSEEELVRLELSYVVEVGEVEIAEGDTLKCSKLCFVQNEVELSDLSQEDILEYEEDGNPHIIDETFDFFGFNGDMKVNNLNEVILRFGFVPGDNSKVAYIRDISVKAYYPDMEAHD